MADEPTTPELPPRTRTAEVLGAGRKMIETVAGLTPQQFVLIVCVVLLGFVCVTQTLQMQADRDERRGAAQERQDAAATTIRENNAQAELTRQHCASESASLRAFFGEQNDKRMRWESEEKAKDRAGLAQLARAFDELRKAILAKKGLAIDD